MLIQTLALCFCVSPPAQQAALQVCEKLALPLGVMTATTKGPQKIWTGKLEVFVDSAKDLTFRQVGETTVVVTDFSAVKPAPSPDQILANHENGILGNKNFVASHLRKTVCTFGETKVVVLDGSTILNTPQRVSPMFIISFAVVENTQVYQFQALTNDQDKYERLLKDFNQITFGGKQITGWPTASAGTFSIVGSPFSVKAPKALYPVLGEKADASLANQYIGAVYVPQGAKYRYVLATLKEDDNRSDEEILQVLARAALETEAPKGLKLDPKTHKGAFAFMKGTVKYEAQVEFRRKGRVAALVGASRVQSGYPFGGVEMVEAK